MFTNSPKIDMSFTFIPKTSKRFIVDLSQIFYFSKNLLNNHKFFSSLTS